MNFIAAQNQALILIYIVIDLLMKYYNPLNNTLKGSTNANKN